MDVDPSWTFDEYQAYEQARLNESLAEQRQASAACALSAPLAELLHGVG